MKMWICKLTGHKLKITGSRLRGACTGDLDGPPDSTLEVTCFRCGAAWRFRGGSTVWHHYPSGQRAGTSWEYWLSDRETQLEWQYEEGKS